MFAFLLRRKASTLIWQYLDGVIPQDRFELLQRLLTRHERVRQQFIDSAMLNALLFAYFNPGRFASQPEADGQPGDAHGVGESDDQQPRERRTKRPAG